MQEPGSAACLSHTFRYVRASIVAAPSRRGQECHVGRRADVEGEAGAEGRRIRWRSETRGGRRQTERERSLDQCMGLDKSRRTKVQKKMSKFFRCFRETV